MTDPLKEFRDRIRAVVPKRDWPRVADEMGVKYGTLRNVMRGATPKKPTLQKMSAWYDRQRVAREPGSSDESAIDNSGVVVKPSPTRVGPAGVGGTQMMSSWMVPVVPVTAAKQSLYFMILFALNTLDDDQVKDIQNEIGEKLTKWRRQHKDPGK